MITYIPAMIGQIQNQYKSNKEWKGKKISFWNNEGFFKHPYVLFSAWYGIKDFKNTTARKTLNIDDDVIIMGDSGGFQAAERHLILDILNTVKWQEENCNRAISYDTPPYRIVSPGIRRNTTKNEFEMRTEVTYINNVQAKKNRNPNSKLEIYNVIHGGNIERREYWWNKMQNLGFERYCVGNVSAGDPLTIAWDTMFLYYKGVKDIIHILGVTGYNTLPIIAYMASYFEEITFDSASWGRGAIERDYFISGKPQEKIPFGVKNLGTDDINEYLSKIFPEVKKCPCPICQSINDTKELYSLVAPGSMGGNLICLHNLWCTIEFVNMLNKLIISNKLKEYIINNCSERAILAMNFINKVIKSGFIEATNYYSKLFLEDSTMEQLSLLEPEVVDEFNF